MRCRGLIVWGRDVYDSVPDNHEAALEVRNRKFRSCIPPRRAKDYYVLCESRTQTLKYVQGTPVCLNKDAVVSPLGTEKQCSRSFTLVFGLYLRSGNLCEQIHWRSEEHTSELQSRP